MGFWSWLTDSPNHEGVTANSNPAGDPATVGAGAYSPGDPHGVEVEGEDTFARSLAMPQSSPWDGWPADWSTPHWQHGIQKLTDVAWSCLDLNASILSTMPAVRLQSGRIVEPMSWMSNPDPAIYSSWHEFAKQLFWDYQMGEAFVMPSDFFANGKPLTFRVIAPHLVKVEMNGPIREYRIGNVDVTEDILHVRYASSTQNPRGIGPLDSCGARLTASGVLSRYVARLAETGGQTHEWIATEARLNKSQAEDLLDQWVATRQRHLGEPAVLGAGAELKQAQFMSAKDMALLELSQHTESRIANNLGVPPFLVGLPSGGDSMTYSNVSSLFDFHDRRTLRPAATAVMAALSGWALPRGQRVDLNADDYTRPGMFDRAQSYEKFHAIGAITSEQVARFERFDSEVSPEALTGGDEL